MALKGDRVIVETDISMTCPTVAERGVGLVVKTSGSGITLGDTAAVADLVADPSGYKVAGVLLNDFVDIDQTKYHRNWHKDEMVIGERANILRKGRVTTNKVTGSPTAGSTAYLTANGVFTPTVSATGGTVATPKMGEFRGAKDESGYATIDINLPVV